jgi:hypothetical protein
MWRLSSPSPPLLLRPLLLLLCARAASACPPFSFLRAVALPSPLPAAVAAALDAVNALTCRTRACG